MAERALLALDRTLHWTLDWYITRTLPGWEHLQLWQNHVCNAYEHRVDQRLRGTGPGPGSASAR